MTMMTAGSELANYKASSFQMFIQWCDSVWLGSASPVQAQVSEISNP